MSPVPAAALLAGLAAAALLADRTISVAIIAAGLFALCLRAPRGRRWPYLVGTRLGPRPLPVQPAGRPLRRRRLLGGTRVPVIGQLDVTSEELAEALFQSLRLVAVGLAFAAYALLFDLDGLLLAGGVRRSVLAVALATRLPSRSSATPPAMSRRFGAVGSSVEGVRGRARLISPLVAGSLERSLNLAESMEARGFGRPGRTRAPSPRGARSTALRSLPPSPSS